MELFFRKYGQGYPIIILHGLYGCSDNWITIARQLSEYAEVYIPDQRNHGQSPHSKEHTYNSMKEDLLDFMNTNEIKKAVILGHSMGGKTAMLFANDYPQKISKLIIVDISPKSYKKDTINTEKHNMVLQTLFNLDLMNVKSYEQAEKDINVKLKEERLTKFLLKNLKKNSSGNFEWKINLMALYNNIEAITNGFDNIDLKLQTFPTLFLKGANSDYIKNEDFDKIKSSYKSSKIVTIPNCGHWLHVEQPNLFIKEVLGFLLET
jgi:esterase